MFSHHMYGYHYVGVHPGVYGGTYCRDVATNQTRWCSYGCCGAADSYCCNANIMVVVGVSVLTLLLTGIIAICCCCCCHMRRKRVSSSTTPGQVINISPVSSTTSEIDVTPEGQEEEETGVPTPTPALHTQNYPPGCYAPPPYSSTPQYPPSQQFHSMPLAPPPYSQAGGQGHKAVTTSSN